MVKFFSSYFLILLVFTSGTFLCLVKGDLCWDDLGRCDANCDKKCTSKYPGGKGSCDVSGSCNCYYDCTLPAPKTCTSGIGRCTAACDDTCCSKNCAAQFPGLEGQGDCNNPIGPAIYNYCFIVEVSRKPLNSHAVPDVGYFYWNLRNCKLRTGLLRCALNQILSIFTFSLLLISNQAIVQPTWLTFFFKLTIELVLKPWHCE
ncbi:hypothetical protein Q3G72_033097 [Acer saccharum]|nr:hypothetical protein Q3G72_033097 [Acer saccharum]